MKIDHWFTGVVEDIADPVGLGRVRVRCMNYHTQDTSLIPTETLPWATCLMPVTTAGGGIGQSTTGLIPGSWVFGFFRDYDQQDPVIIGTVSIPSALGSTSNTGFNDPLGIYPTQNTPLPYGAGTDTHQYSGGYTDSLNISNSISNVHGGEATPLSALENIPPAQTGSKSALVGVARSQIGITESQGNNRGPGIQKFWSAVSGGGYGGPYCAAFVCWCIRESGILPEQYRPKTAGSQSLVYDWARRNPTIVQTIMNPRQAEVGDIAIWTKSPTSGHAAIVSQVGSNGQFKTIDGNTASGGKQGVFEKNRTYGPIRAFLRIR